MKTMMVSYDLGWFIESIKTEIWLNTYLFYIPNIQYLISYLALKVETGEGTSRNDIGNEQIEERHVPNEGHNDLDEGFIDECESTHSNPRVFEKSPSGSQDIPEPNVSMIIPENAGPNRALLKSAGRAFR